MYNNFLQLINYGGKYKFLTFIGCILSGISTIISICPYICIWYIIREIFETNQRNNSTDTLIQFGWLALILSIVGIVIYLIALICTHIAAFRIAKNIRIQATIHLLKLPLGFFDINQSGKLRKLIDDNAGMTETLLAHQLPDIVGAIVTPIATIFLLFLFDWRMGIICLIPILLGVYFIICMMGGKNAHFFSQYQTALEDLSIEATEYVRGIPVVKVFQQTVYSFKNFYNSITHYKNLAVNYTMSCRKPMTYFTTIINSYFLFLIPTGFFLCQTSSAPWKTFTDFIFYILYTPLCTLMISRIIYISQSIMEANEAVSKLHQIFSIQQLENTNMQSIPLKNDIQFRNVTFSYVKDNPPIIKNINFYIPEGKTIALVGASGSGKSTLANLIPRFWDVQKGQILIGGIDIRNIPLSKLMERISFVFQDSKLFKATILENIKAASPTAPMGEVLKAIEASQCSDILKKLPLGLNTVIGTKGVYLSGGETQRIILARAILKNAPIIILDEATAFADPENENLIQKAFENLTRGKTVLMIAHRLPTVKNADRILVLDQGSIIEEGTHMELLSLNGIYSEMWKDYQKSVAWKINNGDRDAC